MYFRWFSLKIYYVFKFDILKTDFELYNPYYIFGQCTRKIHLIIQLRIYL